MGHPAAEAAPDGAAWRANGKHPLPRDSVADLAEPFIGAAGEERGRAVSEWAGTHELTNSGKE